MLDVQTPSLEGEMDTEGNVAHEVKWLLTCSVTILKDGKVTTCVLGVSEQHGMVERVRAWPCCCPGCESASVISYVVSLGSFLSPRLSSSHLCC